MQQNRQQKLNVIDMNQNITLLGTENDKWLNCVIAQNSIFD